MTAKQQPASAGLTQAAGLAQGGGLTPTPEAAAKPRVLVFQTWAMVNGHWLCVHAGPDSEAALTYAKGQIRHDGSSAVTRAEVRALSDDGVAVIWESQ
jgi:hypothetical protein